MATKTKKNEGPTCACGRVDLYDEWLKQNGEEKDEVSTATNPTDNLISSSDDSKKEDGKKVQTKK